MQLKRLVMVLAMVVAVGVGITIAQAPQGAPGAGGPPGGGQGGPGGGAGRGRGGPSLMITSPSFPDGGEVPMKFAGARGGENKSPEFKFNWIQGMNPAERPATVQTYAIIFHDIENSTRGGTEDTLHWSIYNIPGTATGLPEGLPAGALPDGSTHGPGIRGGPTGSYFGPGAGATLRHNHYIFEFYALDSKLDFPAGPPTRAQLLAAMEGKIVGKAAYVGRFRSPAPAQ
jgi:phosphatidylethanolamine-binding protein (PEBP) family uncharacterized protein